VYTPVRRGRELTRLFTCADRPGEARPGRRQDVRHITARASRVYSRAMRSAAALAFALAAVAACSSPPSDPRTAPESTIAPMRAACAFAAGDPATKTIGTDFPIGDEIPIKHVIVIMQENRSFDEYFGQLVALGDYAAGEVDVPPATWSMPDTAGTQVMAHLDNEHCFTANHGWNDMHQDWDNGKNDMFVVNNDPDGQRVMGYQDHTTIPFYFALAKTFAIGDAYHASVMTSTWPNRLFLMAATSFGIGDNSFVMIDTKATPVQNVMAELDAAGRTWKDYTDGPHMIEFFQYYGFLKSTIAHLADVRCDLMNDIAMDTLPDVSFVMGNETVEWSDEGPSDLPGIGGLVVENIVRALWASPAWKDTVVFIVYDENGGTADHVPPADACAPDDLAPHDGNGNAFTGDFKKTGFRVPMTVVSPYAKAHYVSHTIMDHASITRFIEARFGLPAMTGRDANATPPFDMFDFKNPPFLTPPNITETTTVDPTVLTACGQMLAPTGCAGRTGAR
jgi:phospholipase C